MSIESLNTERIRKRHEKEELFSITKAPSFEWGFLIHAILIKNRKGDKEWQKIY